MELLDSEEPKEREYLKIILHRLYAKLVARRKMIRKAITDCFFTLIHETYKFNGVSELLDILAGLVSLKVSHNTKCNQWVCSSSKRRTCNFL